MVVELKETVVLLWVGKAKHINSLASPPEGYSWEFLVGVSPGSPSTDPISDQKMSFSTPVFRSGVRFSNVPVAFRARNQMFKSKYKE